jgi:hypothetical protein
VDTDDLTAVAEKLGRGKEQLTAEAQERAREVGDQLRHQLEDALKPAVHQAAPSLGKGLLAAVRALVALPVLLLRFAGRLVSAAEAVPEQGAELKQRAQHLLHDHPRARRQRRQRRLQLAAWTGAGFGVGVGLGWFLGRRSASELVYDPPLPVPTMAPAATPATTTGPDAPPEELFEAAAAAEEVLEDQLAAAADAEEVVEAHLDEAARAEATDDQGQADADEHGGAGEEAAEDEATDRPTPEA